MGLQQQPWGSYLLSVLCLCMCTWRARPHFTNSVYCMLPQSNEDTIQDSLQVMANALEGGHWNLVEWLVQNHEADAIGPYFLNAIASQGKHEDMKRMLQLIEKHCKDQGYVNDQVQALGCQGRGSVAVRQATCLALPPAPTRMCIIVTTAGTMCMLSLHAVWQVCDCCAKRQT